MDIERLSRFGGTVRDRVAATWAQMVDHFTLWLRWLQLRPQVQSMLLSVGMGIVLVLMLVVFLGWYSFEL